MSKKTDIIAPIELGAHRRRGAHWRNEPKLDLHRLGREQVGEPPSARLPLSGRRSGRSRRSHRVAGLPAVVPGVSGGHDE